MIELTSKPLIDYIDHRAAFSFRFAARSWRATVKPVRKLDVIHLEATVRPGGDLMSKIDPEPVICCMLAEELLGNPPSALASAFNTLIRSARKASGLFVPPEPVNVRFDHELIAKHPKIFPGAPRSADGEGWFLACGPGWSELIDTLCSRIQQHVDGHSSEQLVAAHVKEKFGALRFAYNLAQDDQRIAGMVEMACAMSMRICEICGDRGKTIASDGWHRTRCDNHIDAIAE